MATGRPARAAAGLRRQRAGRRTEGLVLAGAELFHRFRIGGQHGGLPLGVGTCPIHRNPGANDLSALLRFTGWLRERRPDVVHGHGSKGGVYARLAPGGGTEGSPIRAYTPHGGSFNYKPGSLVHRLYMQTERALTVATDLFLFESAYIAERFDKYVGSEAPLRRVAPNGLDEAEFAPVAPAADAADLLYVGELRAAKGIDTLLEALPLGQAKMMTFELIPVGPLWPLGLLLREPAK